MVECLANVDEYDSDVKRLTEEKARIEREMNAGEPSSCLESLSKSFQHVFADMSGAGTIGEQTLSKARADMEKLFGDLVSLSKSLRAATPTKILKRSASDPPISPMDVTRDEIPALPHPTGGHRYGVKRSDLAILPHAGQSADTVVPAQGTAAVGGA